MAKQHSPRFLAIVNDSKARIRECTVKDVKQMLDSAQPFALLDVREESEFAKGRLPGARHVSKGVIERDIEKVVPEPSTPIVVYCGGGFRSALAADALVKMGYTDVISMDGGWTGWQEAGYPIETPEN